MRDPAAYTSTASRYLPPLTGIRALAALLVLAMHTEQNVPAGAEAILPFVARGYLGVDFFFVLSGYIITHVYFASLASPNFEAVRIFLWHRFVRLYPVHITVLAGLVAVVSFVGAAGYVLNNPQEWQWKDLLWQLTLLQAWGVTQSPGWNSPAWSISAEWFAYLLFPLLAPALVWVRRQGTALLIALAALGTTALLFATAGWILNTWVGAPALTRVFGEFLCGAALCRSVALSHGARGFEGDILAGGAFAAFLFGASIGFGDFALVALLAVTILGTAMSRGSWTRILGTGPLLWLGEISYSVYMVHFPVLIVVRRFWERLGFAEWGPAGKVSAFLATDLLVVALAAVLFYLVERPVRARLRDRMGSLKRA
jgi:peptidoglycan/LPS O-acetylase OafA/YrhL